MIEAAILDERALSVLRCYYRALSPPVLTVPGAVLPAAAANLRARLLAAGLRPYWIADRGRYHVNDSFTEPVLFAALLQLAERITEVPLTLGPARWVRLVRRDYSLMKDDGLQATSRAPHIELTLDFSAASSEEAQVVYTDGMATLIMLPQQHGAVSLIERGPTLYRYERYLNHRLGDAEIFRLRLALHF